MQQPQMLGSHSQHTTLTPPHPPVCLVHPAVAPPLGVRFLRQARSSRRGKIKNADSVGDAKDVSLHIVPRSVLSRLRRDPNIINVRWYMQMAPG